ncbi:MAG: hypothetical protein K9J30_08265 [Bacteroidales bacterium]|nr:hypothetical protein [Bacteroidales bacterium]
MTDQANKDFFPLLREDYVPPVPPYVIIRPEIPSGSTYYFLTDSGLEYEVIFAKKRDNYLGNIINFSVISEEFEDDEYSVTNRGEIYRVIATVAEIIRIYHEYHGYSVSYEFSGEFKETDTKKETSVRTLLYYRKARQILQDQWGLQLTGNKVIVYRKKNINE